jgi:hypothetical protein
VSGLADCGSRNPRSLATALSPVFCSLVHHLPEIMRARSEARSMEWITKAALCGTCKTLPEAERKRADARAFAAQLGLRGLAAPGVPGSTWTVEAGDR